MAPALRERILAERRLLKLPWHGPPHFKTDLPRTILFTAACFEHRHLLGTTKRLLEFERELLDVLSAAGCPAVAWVVLPNHYHVLVPRADARQIAGLLGRLHGRSSFRWNREDKARGRRVWYRSQDRVMRGQAHLLATVNYIHHNPVRHGYAEKWQDWPCSSIHRFLADAGREQMARLWRDYPLLDYGDGWDEP